MKMTNRTKLVALSGAVAFAALAVWANPASAQDANATAVGTGVGVSESNSNSASASEANSVAAAGVAASGNSVGNSQGQQVNIVSSVPRQQNINTTSTIKNVPNVYAPGLAAAGSEVCLGSFSVGGAGAGFGLSIGGTLKDKECTLRLNAKTLAILGYREAARETMCLDPDVRTAMAAAGTPCNSDRAAVVNARAQAAYSQNAAPAVAPATAAYAAAPTAGTQVAGRNCRREYQLVGGWYDVCE